MEAFQAHQAAAVDPETLQKWRQALNDASQISGLTLDNRDEEKFIQEIMKDLRTMQNPEELLHIKYPVGVESRAEDIITALRLNDQVFNIVAILGISGSGKTTVVKAVYDRIAADFEYRCFIEDVYSYEDRWGRSWKFELQKDVISCLTRDAKYATCIGTHTNGAAKIMKMITGRNVLLVLDGVDTFEHLEALGLHYASFSRSSRIILTTRNKQSLVNLSYTPCDMRLLETTESFELFVGLTFGRDDPNIDRKFVEQVVWCAGGLPMVLDVWSRHFKCYERKQWPSILETLKRIPHEKVQEKLQMSYDPLTKRAKKLFLDIACFFDGMRKDLVVKVLPDVDSGFFPEFEIQHLVDKGLVKISEYEHLLLHKAIKEMGQEVVRQENEDEPGQRTRLVGVGDLIRVYKDCSGTKLSVESIFSWINCVNESHVQVKALKKMRNLRLIRLISYPQIWSPFHDEMCFNAQTWSYSFHDKMAPLSLKKLKYMEWDCFPFKSLDTIDMGNVVVLRLRRSRVLEKLWEGMKSLKKLRILDVSFSKSLTKIGDFIGLENLEELYLKDCDHLEELHGSICKLHKLRYIELDGCANLDSIPNLPPSIEVMDARRCKSLVNFHNNSSPPLNRLIRIMLDGCANLNSIPDLPPNIEVMEARDCISLVNLPDNIGLLPKLKEIILDGCVKLESIPNLPPNTRVVNAKNCISMVNLPNNSSQLYKLSHINLDGCVNLRSIPNLPPSFEVMSAKGCISLVNLPDNIDHLLKLKIIVLNGCVKLKSIPNLQPSIEVIEARDCTRLVNLPDCISHLYKLSQIELVGCVNIESIPNLPPNIKMWETDLYMCSNLESIPNLPSSTEAIDATNCTSLVNLPDSIAQLPKLRDIVLDTCVKLESIPNLPPSVESIEANDCTSLVNLPSNMSELQDLSYLYLNDCFKLEPEAFKKVSELRNLSFLGMKYCNVSQISSEIGNLVTLKGLDLSGNTFPSLPDSFSNLSHLKSLWINDCSQLQLLPLLPSNLRYIEACSCWSLAAMQFDLKKMAYIFRSKLFEESCFTGELVITLSGVKLPDWCSFQNRGDVLSIVAPTKSDKKICGVIICATIEWDSGLERAPYPTIQNRTKNTGHVFKGEDYYGCSMPVMLDDTTLAVEGGDIVVLGFDDAIDECVLSCGLRLIYEDDLLDSALLIQDVPAARYYY